MENETQQPSFTPSPQLDLMPMSNRSPDFSRYYVNNRALLDALFDRLTGTAIDRSTEPPKRVRVPHERRHMNEDGANAAITLLMNSGLDKNAILSNTDLDRVMAITRETTLDCCDHLIINSEAYGFDMIKDLGIVQSLLFNTLELALRRSIGRGAARDVSQFTSENRQSIVYEQPQQQSQAVQPQGMFQRFGNFVRGR